MTLAELLATDDYAGLSDAEAAALANEKRHAVTIDVYHTYRSLAGATGIGVDATDRLVATMDAFAASGVPRSHIASEMRHSLRGSGDPPGINANDPGTQAMLDAFAAEESLPLTAADAAAIKALAGSTESDAERYSLGEVRPGDIQVARAN